MEKYAILLGYYDKQFELLEKLKRQIFDIDLSIDDKRYVFALKVQQFYTAIEDLLKQIAKSFENHIQELAGFHKELLLRLSMEIPKIRPRVLSEGTFLFLDKLRAFRHFIRHAYDCELRESELRMILELFKERYKSLEKDLEQFRHFVADLSSPGRGTKG